MFVAKVSKGDISGTTLTDVADTSYRVDSVFLKVIVRGKNVSLYSYKDDIKTRYYVLNNRDNELKELGYYAFESPKNQSVVIVRSYRRQLLATAYSFIDNDQKVIRAINNADYDEVTLLKIAQAINQSSGEQVTYETQTGARLFLGAAIRNNKLTFKDFPTPFKPGTSTTGYAPAVSFGIDYIANKRTKKLVLRAEVMLAANRYNFSNVSLDDRGSTASLDVKQFNVSLMPQLIYNFYTGDNLMAYFGAGVGFNYSTYNNYTFYGNYPNFAVSTDVKNKYPEFEKVSFTAPFKLGVVVNNTIEIGATYFYPSVLVTTDRTLAKATAFQLGVNYLFGK